MENFIFISDFDGTLTQKDFYQIIIDRYLGQWGNDLYSSWKRNELKDVQFLSQVFQAINRNEEQISKDIAAIELDPYAKDFINHIKSLGGQFVVLSAGTSYYIDKVLEIHGIKDVKVISNPGCFENNGIKMLPDINSPYYSDIYGVNKYLVVKDYKDKYERVYYAGDSTPDLKACMAADMVFARNKLVELLEENNHPYIPFRQFKDIEEYLMKME
jgi:2,3-diketo-5-methylthio-1-phosphopentane phosphatase